MKIVIDDTYFDMPIGRRLLKTRYPTCIFPAIRGSWDKQLTMSFREILETITDPRQRSVAIHCLPLSTLLVHYSLIPVAVERKCTAIQMLEKDGSIRTYDRHVQYELFSSPLSQIETILGDKQPEGDDPIQWFIRRCELDTKLETIRWIGSNEDLIDPDHTNVMELVASYIRTDYAPGDIARIVWTSSGVECVPRFGAFRISTPRSLTAKEYIGILYNSPIEDDGGMQLPTSSGKFSSPRFAAPGSMDPTSWRWTGNLNSYIKATCFLEPEDRSLLEDQIWFSNHTEGIIGERLFHFKADGVLCLKTVMLLDKIFRSMHSCIDNVREQVMWPHREKLKSSPLPMRLSAQPESVTRPVDLLSRGAGSVLAQFGKGGIEVYVSVY